MAYYIIEIDEKSKRGKALKTLLQTETASKLRTIDEYEAMEAQVIMKEIRKAEKSPLLSFEEGKKEFEKLKKRLKK